MTEPDAERLMSALRQVIDPELGQNIVDLGLVYAATIDGGVATVTMTLTTPGCPAGPLIVSGVRAAAGDLDGVGEVVVDVVWSPRWTPEMMSPELREHFGVSD